jgi:hypothetical protein
MKRHRVHLPRILAAVALVATTLAVAPSPKAAAASYDNTNPGQTICGDGSHPVVTWYSWYLATQYSSQKVALVELRRSDTCNTVWTRVTNVTGLGTGYVAATALTFTERVEVFNCITGSCLTATSSSTDTLQPAGRSPNSGWSNQRTLPAGATVGGMPQPPSTRATATVSSVSVVAVPPAEADWIRPVWAQLDSNYPISPFNCVPGTCYAWPKTPSGLSVTVPVYLDPNLGTANIDLRPDVRSAWAQWNAAPARNPYLREAAAGEEPLVSVDRYDTPVCGFHGSLASTACTQTWYTGNVTTSCEVSFNPFLSWNHALVWTDTQADSRKVAVHELGHCEGLGHVGISAIMTRGPVPFWQPQSMDILGLQAIYGRWP